MKTLIPVLFFLLLSIVFNFSSPNIPDPDSFYHIAHAKIYRTEGITFKEFPWTQFSTIKQYSADLWYGFHILLIPFSYFSGTLGIKLAGVLLTFFVLHSLFFVLKKLNVVYSGLWTFLAFVSAPNILNRLLMMRPHLLSLALIILIFYYLTHHKNQVTHTLSIRSYAQCMIIFTLSFLVSWIHLSLVWIPVMVFGIVFLIKLIIEKTWFWREGLVLLAGSITGWLARPNPIGAIKLAYIQVIELMLQKQQEVTLLFGREIFPLALQTLFQNFSAFVILWFFAIVVLILLIKKHTNILENVGMLSSGIISIIFFILTLTTARRSHDIWIPFGIIFIALVLSEALKLNKKNSLYYITIFITGLVTIFLTIYTPYKNSTSLKENAIKPTKFKEAALWLKENSQPKDIVFNVRWSDFPMLFYWNNKNYYIGGMDPIFQYSFDKNLYWKFHYISVDEVTKYTCATPACTKEMLVDTYTVLKNDFKAKYVFLEKQRNPLFYYYLESTPKHYAKKIDTLAEAVYEIK
ncbi:MAG: hypothetical protein Q8Q95_00250 [bacterium]|nr:hypothetical protein [bacterium]